MDPRPSLRGLADLLGGKLLGPDGDASVEGVSTIRDAGPAEVCYYGNPLYRGQLSGTRALAVIASAETPTSARNTIIVPNPYDAFRKVLELFAPDRRSGFTGVHPSAVVHGTARLAAGTEVGPGTVIDRDAEIGAGTSVGPCCYLGPGVTVGSGCVLHSSVVLEAETVVGDRVVIHAGSVLGSDGFGFVPDPSGHKKVPQNGRVVVESDVEIGANCTIDRAVTGATVVGRFCKLDNLVHLAHNVSLGPGCLLAAQTGIAGSTSVGCGVVFGGQAGIGGHLVIGDRAVITAQSGVTKNVAAGETVSGYPARAHRRALRVDAAVSRLPEFMDRVSEAIREPHSAEE